ncbi:MAG: glycosyltransferase family 4 protein [Aureispira sp.]
MEKIYLVLYTSRLGIGGIQTFVLQMAEALQAYPNVQVAIFCHYPELSEEEGIPKGVELWALSKSSFVIKVINKLRNLLQVIRPQFDLKEWLTKRYFFKQIKKIQQAHQVIIHNNIQVGDALVYDTQQKLGVPYITTLHGAYKHILREEVSAAEEEELRQVFLNLLETASSIVYLSSKNLEPFYKLLPQKTITSYPNFERIYNGLAAPEVPVKDTSTTHLVFGMVARGHPDKGWVDVLEVAQELIQEGYINFELRLFADGDYVGTLLQEKDWFPQIQYFGSTNTPLKEIVTFDVGLLPSYYEEMPFTIIEYLACGKVCIATDVGAIAEMIEAPNGDVAGVLVPINQEKKVDRAALKKAFLHFLNDPTVVSHYQQAVQGAFEKFDLKHTAKDYYQLYKNAIKK